MSAGAMAQMSATQRSFQTTYAPLLVPRSRSTMVNGHEVTQRSMDRSWASLTSPQRTGGLAPSEYSQRVEQDFRHTTETKRLAELAASTASMRRSPSARKNGTTARSASLGGGRRRTQSPARVEHKASVASVRLHAPVRSRPGGPQRREYERAGPYSSVPNPASTAFSTESDAEADAAAQALRCFPFSSRPAHHFHNVNPTIRAGYATTSWDDRFASAAYQPYQVELVSTARPVGDSEAQEVVPPASVTGGPSDTPPALAATALGFGRRHAEYKRYVHHVPPRSLAQEASGPLARAAAEQNKVVMEVAPHILSLASEGGSAAVGSAAGLALAVPYKLARFVPLDDRDGQGKGGHVNASGLG